MYSTPQAQLGGYSHKPSNLSENSSELRNKSREFSYHKAISCIVHALHTQDLPSRLPLRSMLDSQHIYIYPVYILFCSLPEMTQLTRKSPKALRLILRGLLSPETEGLTSSPKDAKENLSIFEVGPSAPGRELNCVYAINAIYPLLQCQSFSGSGR